MSDRSLGWFSEDLPESTSVFLFPFYFRVVAFVLALTPNFHCCFRHMYALYTEFACIGLFTMAWRKGRGVCVWGVGGGFIKRLKSKIKEWTMSSVRPSNLRCTRIVGRARR